MLEDYLNFSVPDQRFDSNTEARTVLLQQIPAAERWLVEKRLAQLIKALKIFQREIDFLHFAGRFGKQGKPQNVTVPVENLQISKLVFQRNADAALTCDPERNPLVQNRVHDLRSRASGIQPLAKAPVNGGDRDQRLVGC